MKQHKQHTEIQTYK